MRTSLLLVLSVPLFASGCIGTWSPQPATAQPVVVPTDAQVQSLLATGAYRNGSGFVLINATAYPTALNQTDTVDMFVTANDVSSYVPISPDTTHTALTFPVGGILVREPHGTNGAVSVLTVMVKEPAGYWPAGGDFLFGVTGTDGKPVVDPQMGTLWGQVTECGTCHAKRAGDAYLWGVPTNNRSAAGHP